MIALAGRHLDHLDGRLRAARHLRRDRLALDALLVPQRQHDGADHGDQQDQPGALEVVDVLGVEHAADRLRVGDAGAGRRDRRGGRGQRAGLDHREAHAPAPARPAG